jgi:hypothetical protein
MWWHVHSRRKGHLQKRRRQKRKGEVGRSLVFPGLFLGSLIKKKPLAGPWHSWPSLAGGDKGRPLEAHSNSFLPRRGNAASANQRSAASADKRKCAGFRRHAEVQLPPTRRSAASTPISGSAASADSKMRSPACAWALDMGIRQCVASAGSESIAN